jgi:integrase/recombinase XerD
MHLTDAIRRYLNAQLADGRSVHTIKGAKSVLRQVATFLAGIGVGDVAQFDGGAIARYREDLAWRPTFKGTPLTVRSQLEQLGHISAFSRFLVAQGWLLIDPAAKITRPRKPSRLPRDIMEPKEVEQVMAQPDMRTAQGFRDRAILEVLYSSAIRREEVANLHVTDVDTDGGYVFVREGKGAKDRVVPLGREVCDLVRAYLVGVRREWIGADRDPHLFLNRWGKGMTPNAVWHVVSKAAKRAGLEKRVSTHTFRHSCATHMVRNGAPIRQLQEMLGHASLETTQLYARVTINDLHAMHRRFHPREVPSSCEQERSSGLEE